MAANSALTLLKKSCLVFIGMMTLLSNGSAMASSETYFSGSQLLLAKAITNGDSNAVASLAKETDLNKPGRQDMTLLFYALQTASSETPQQLKILSELVKQGADPFQPVPDMNSVAVFAAKAYSSKYLKALVSGGMSVNGKYRSTPIVFYAASDDTLDNLRFLVEKGADVNSANGVGRTAIMDALSVMQLETVIYLLNHGANPNAITNLGWGFATRLQDEIKDVKDSPIKNRLEEIRNIAISKGMTWPPTPY